MAVLTSDMRRSTRIVLCLALWLSTWAATAAAQGGVRAGASVDPDQFYVGGHYETGALVDRLHFRPSLEVGIGDDVVTTSLNFEFVYKFPTRSLWGLYAGGGPAVHLYAFDQGGGGRGRDDGDTETEGGLNLLFGAEHRRGLFVEVKVGAIDSPDLKFGVGWTFR